ncbi:DUF1796 family putative cysteine peptidase [Cohaesibacter marisflavi]|uniref:DUF1796 family putative cysteine peptidase n=1 Tax=Cohaesibacter marisflavi TaxID=655353 RepID=UPI0029C7E7D5|nr:DUF1796 family putative cysteine peptidase [Cohaesibacter marisflavi]
MSKSIISLGSGCDVATVLKNLGIRKDKYPFDWIWNFDEGLKAVTSIIESDFRLIQSRDSYIYTSHHTWPDKQTLVYKAYPGIAHIHSNPYESPADLTDFNRRIERFRSLLKCSDTQTTFVFYQPYTPEREPSDQALANVIQGLRDEATSFINVIQQKYPDKPFKLVCLLALPAETIGTATRYESLQRLPELSEEIVSFDIAPIREDVSASQRRAWLKAWFSALERTHAISRYDRYLSSFRKMHFQIDKKLKKKFV